MSRVPSVPIALAVGRAERTLGLARAENEDRLAAAAHGLADELVRRLDFEPLGTSAQLEPRRRIALADQVRPERILDLRHQLVRRDRQSLRGPPCLTVSSVTIRGAQGQTR